MSFQGTWGGYPTFVAFKIRTVKCDECGSAITGRLPPRPPWLCFNCRLKRTCAHLKAQHDKTHPTMAKSIAAGEATKRQIAAKSGPLYEKWKAATERHLSSLP